MPVKHPEPIHIGEFFSSHVPGLGTLFGKGGENRVHSFSGREIRPGHIQAATSSAQHTRIELFREVIGAEVKGIEEKLRRTTGKNIDAIMHDERLSRKCSEDLHRRKLLLDEMARADEGLQTLEKEMTHMSKSISTQSLHRN